MYFRSKYLIAVSASVIFTAFLIGCKDSNWNDHNAVQSSFKTNLWEAINTNPDLSIFASFLSTTGYDELLQSSKMFTVWAPTDSSLKKLDASIVNDVDKLKQFVGNHICYNQYFTQTPQPTLRIKMINGKYLNWSKDNLDGVSLVSFDKYTKNGALHVLANYISPQKNIWDFFNSSTVAPKQLAYIQSLNYLSRIDSLATKIGVDPATGKPIYEPGTGLVSRNKFIEQVANLMNEDSLYTFIMLEDAAYDNEMNKLLPYFMGTLNTDSTALRSWFLVKDLAFNNYYTPENLPDTLVSKFNVKVPMDKLSISETHKLSNGVVYVMKKVDFPLKEKIRTIVVEGENFRNFYFYSGGQFSIGNSAYIHRRARAGAYNGMDLQVTSGYGSSVSLVIAYRPAICKVKYKVYWVAYNNLSSGGFSQRLSLGPIFLTTSTSPASGAIVTNYNFPPDFKNTAVGYLVSDRVYLGDYGSTRYQNLNMWLISSGSNVQMVLDRIELVPVLP